MILAWMLLAGNWAMLPGVWQWAVGRFVPTLILVGMLIDLGAFIGTRDANKYGKDTQDVKYRVDSVGRISVCAIWQNARVFTGH